MRSLQLPAVDIIQHAARDTPLNQQNNRIDKRARIALTTRLKLNFCAN
jgi:hypothetical protein